MSSIENRDMPHFRSNQNRPPWMRLVLLAGLIVNASSTWAGETYTQVPATVRSQVRTEPQPNATGEGPEAALLAAGPAPTWIWGPDANKTYVLRKEFPGRTNAAWLRASCDNQMTISINGQRVVSSDKWEEPVEVNIQKYLQRGRNEIVAEVRNAGGAAGFLCQLAFVDRSGAERFLVSDETWEVVDQANPDQRVAVKTLGKHGVAPWNDLFSKATGPVARHREAFNVLPGFQVELLFTVPKEQLGSWVAIGFDNRGRLIASDQENKGLCRVTVPPWGSQQPVQVESLDLQLSTDPQQKISAAQGILYAFDSLYLSVNGGPGSGLYRARDTNGDDQFDEVVKLRDFRGGGEHGPHALRLSPDGESIYVIAGNHTDPPPLDASTVPSNWQEDLLLPRQWDARGHAVGKLAPGGWIARLDPDGKTCEMWSIGYRNSYDMDFNADGELFAYDSDMEWDMGTPWYRPTRVVHATSGSEFGWRSGTGKWPTYHVDSLPPLLDVGPGSPVGVAFGYGAKFPAQYQTALYICDWTFGTMYAVHIEPEGASYKATKEEFLSRTPLPLTDNAVGPDGALYFTTGGRGAQSELYRVIYVGGESTAPVSEGGALANHEHALRRQIEKYHRPSSDAVSAVGFLWPHLSHPDRHIRYAARVALEHQDLAAWQERALAEQEPQTLITAAVAFARQGDPALEGSLLGALDRIEFAKLTETQQLELLRAWSLIFMRLGKPDQATAAQLVAKLDPFFPAASDRLNRELCNVLVYLNSPTVVTKTLELLAKPSEQVQGQMSELLARNVGYGGPIAQMLRNPVDLQKLHYAFALRNVRYGWTLEQRRQYFAWLADARTKSGGASYEGFIDNTRKDALANASETERKALESEVAIAVPKPAELPKPVGPGHDWTLDEVVQRAGDGLRGRNFERGRQAYAAARCVICHRFDGEGGATGPDLTNLAGRFGVKDLTESLVDPSKVVSDQYRASIIVTTKGQTYAGRIVNERDGNLTVLTDPEDISKVAEIPAAEVDDVRPSAVSLMPKDLLKPLNESEVLDLLAYLLSRGDPNDAMFQ